MFRYLPVALLAGFVLEIASIIWVGSAIGVIPTLLLLAAGGIVGVNLIRLAGTNVTTALRSSIQDPRLHRNLAGSAMSKVFAGVLFLVPGFFSDGLGVLLLLPPIQGWLASRVSSTIGVSRRPEDGAGRRFGTMIEGEIVEIDGEIVPPDDGGNAASRR